MAEDDGPLNINRVELAAALIRECLQEPRVTGMY